MNTDILIPITVTLVTGMAVGAIYLLYWLLSEGKPEGGGDADNANSSPSAEADPAAATEQSSAADTHH
jgi:flagellar basal body-associated protein FliL